MGIVNRVNVIRVCYVLVVVLTVFNFSSLGIDFLINERLVRVPSLNGYQTLGHHLMRNSTATFIGLGMNIEENLPSLLRQIDSSMTLFREARFLYLDGNSSDNTIEIFRKWVGERNNAEVVVSTYKDRKEIGGHFDGRNLPREGRLAMSRNDGLAVLRSRPPTDFVVMIDMDIVGWDMKGLIDSFSRAAVAEDMGVQPWDVMCANGIILGGLFRDTYAFRQPGINTNHHWAGTDYFDYNMSEAGVNQRQVLVKRSKLKTQELITRASKRSGQWSADLVSADSCFGGLALYRTAAMKDCTYDYRHPEPPRMLDCEHVLFHRCMKRDSDVRIFVNPNMKLWYGHGVAQTAWTWTIKEMVGWFNSKSSYSLL